MKLLSISLAIDSSSLGAQAGTALTQNRVRGETKGDEETTPDHNALLQSRLGCDGR